MMSLRRMTPSAARGDRGRFSFRIAGDLLEPHRRPGGDLFAALVAVFGVLMLRYLGSEDFAVAGRNGDSETLALRIELPDDPTFLDLSERIRNAIHRVSADPGRILPAEIPSSKALLVLSAALPESDDASYDLIIAFTESPHGLEGICEYNSDQFEDAQARALTKHFGNLLKEAATRPTAPISGFEMLDAAEKHRALIEWNGERRPYLAECCHELFEQQVERTPGATAAECEGVQLTYRELNRKANQLAHYLRRKGVGPEVPVGVLLDASLEIVIALFAILKAGGAYLVLNHGQPAQRLRTIIRESRLSVCVSAASNTGSLGLVAGMEFVCLDTEAGRIAAESSSNPCSAATPDSMVSVRYTSGSTGTPKGAVSIHRSITARLTSLRVPEIEATDVCLVSVSWGFGPRFFSPLTVGGKVVIIPDDAYKDVNRLTDSLERNGITRIFIAPSHFRQLLSLGPGISCRLARLRTVNAGGEALTADLAGRFKELLPHVRLVNTYSSAELGGLTAMHSLVADSDDEGSLATGNLIGRPVANTSIYILDRDMNPVPQGVVGEMFVGSGHMGRGYLHRPDLTARSFLTDPFGTCPGGHLFRTGDLGRHLPDGKIEFIGRADRQVKVRGHRIELEEIEAVLHRNDQVHQAVVMAQKAGSDNRLVSWVVPKTGIIPRLSHLHSFLRQRLPDYMIPAAFVFLDQMPLTETGKVDMQALPVPGTGRPPLDTPHEAPRNPIEVAITEIWSAVLGIEGIGINDNFIELGGDSLLATSVSARLLNLGLDVPMELILEWSIATIAAETGGAVNTAMISAQVPSDWRGR
jgi:amino acid adenylation domain-containing protein